MMKPTSIASLASLGILLVTVIACETSQRDASIGADCTTGFCEPAPNPATFGDAAAPDGEARPGAEMCPSTSCGAGYATCPGSTFACDVHIARDLANCGVCGKVCPDATGQVGGMSRVCIDGQCRFQCWPETQDCDGLPDNGCEIIIANDPMNCGACGKQCQPDELCSSGKCEPTCPPPKTKCNDLCADLSGDDENCGACGVACSNTIPSEYRDYPNTYYGCVETECRTKCDAYWADCNKDIEDGCEVDLQAPDDENCGYCGNKCGPGEKCRPDGFAFSCSCDDIAPGLVDCSTDPTVLTCSDLVSDPDNCGGCGIVCASRRCSGGVCQRVCPKNMADCNGAAVDGCETNLASDPENCGECGHACNGTPGQPCIAGSCAVEECGGPK